MKNVFIGFRKFLALGVTLTLAIALFLALGVSASAAEGELVIAESKKSDYVIIAGTGSSDSKTAYDLSSDIYKITKADVYDYPTTEKEKAKEILVGATNRPLSLDLIADITENYAADSVTWGFAVRDEKLALYANSPEALEFCLDELYEKYLKDGRFAVPKDLYDVSTMTREEYEDYVADQERIEAEEREKRRREKIEFYKNAIAEEFENSDFGPYITDMTEATKVVYDAIASYPTVGEHPRVLVNAEMLVKIREDMETRNSAAESSFWAQANSEIANDGKLPAASASGVRGFNNFDLGILRVIQTKAFAYLLTGDELYALEALYAMKNYLVTLDVQWITSDGTREFGYCMYIAACVYDWCYDILSADDKFQLAAGVEHILCTGTMVQADKGSYGGVKMEVGFPPTGQGAVCGHGSERAILRDYLSMAIAIYDEEPTWYDYVGGRIYDQYIPVRNEFYKSGIAPQGTSEYAPGRFMSDLYSAMLFVAMSGENPYDDGMANVVLSFMGHETYGKKVFSQGDLRLGKNSLVSQIGYCGIMSAYLYDDAYALAVSAELSHGYTTFYTGTYNVSFAEALICMQNGIEPAESHYDGMDKILYNGGIIGQIIARENWNDSSAAISLMKIGTRSTANHDHQASGSFQIYYKGLLTGDAGVYDSYGTAHHKHFHQATISHNSLLIYNPALSGKNSGYYSGGQRQLSEPKTYESWMSESYKTGEVLGYSYGYDQKGNTKFSYISGDITYAYDVESVDFVGRTMLSVFTEDEDFPMLFFVFDRIDTPDPTFKKTFLLQISGNDAPVVDGNRVTTTNGDGKLVLQSLLGGDKITPLGGEGNNYLVNGVQLGSKTDADTWGRVEISPKSGSKSDVMLNVMYVTDKKQTESLDAYLLETSSDNAVGAKIASTVAVFGKNALPEMTAITVNAGGEGIIDYYFGNIAVGTWRVISNGDYIGTVYSTNEAKMVTFKAPAGEITLEPSSDVGSNPMSKIKYVTDGGILPDDAPTKYEHGVLTELPKTVTRNTDLFLGWYADAEYTQKITHIPESAEGMFTVYARWSKVYVNEDYTDYETEQMQIPSSGSIGTGISLNGSGGVLNDVYTDKEKGALIWTTYGKGPAINMNSANHPFAKISSNAISFEFTLAKLADVDNMNVEIRVRDENKNQLTLANISGTKVTVGGVTVATLSEREVTVRIVLDFATAKVYVYDEGGDVITANSFTVPEEYSSGLEWQTKFNKEICNMYAKGEGTLVVGKIFIAETNIYSDGDVANDNYIVYPDGVGLPDGYVKKYTPGIAAKLPESAVKDGFRFDGWYSDESLTSRITEVPESASGPFTVFAKWNRIYVDESWSTYAIDQSGVTSAAGIGQGIALNGGNSSLNDVKSDNEKGTLTWTVYGKGPAIVVKNKTNPIGSLSEDAISIEMSLAKPADANAPRLSFRIRDKDKKQLVIAEMSGGSLSVGKTEIVKLSEAMQTVRIVIDFAAAKIYAYDAYGNGIASADISVPEGYESVAAWRASFLEEVINVYAGGAGSLVIGHVYICEGNIYGEYKYSAPENNVITYPSDATLPEDAPTSYEAGKGTPLPKAATKSGYAFLGWYLDEALTAPVAAVPADAVGEFKVFAKWTRAFVNESYDSYAIDQSDVTSSSAVGSSISLNGGNGSLNDVTSDNEKGTLIWTSTGSGPALVTNNSKNPMSGVESGIFTYEFSFEYMSGVDYMNLHIRTRDANKKEISLALITDGVVSFGGEELYTVAEDKQVTLRFVVDFKNAKVYLYDDSLSVYKEKSFTVPDSYASAADWQKNFTKEVVNIRAEDGGTVLVHHLIIAEGNLYADGAASVPGGDN